MCARSRGSVTEGGSVNIYFHTRPPLAPVHCRLYRVRCPGERLLVNRYCLSLSLSLSLCMCLNVSVDYLFTEEERLSPYRIVSLRRHSALSSHVQYVPLAMVPMQMDPLCKGGYDFTRVECFLLGRSYTLNRSTESGWWIPFVTRVTRGRETFHSKVINERMKGKKWKLQNRNW